MAAQCERLSKFFLCCSLPLPLSVDLMVANGGPTPFPNMVFFISGVINVERTTLDYDVSVLSEMYYVRSLDAYCMQLVIHSLSNYQNLM